MFVFWLLLVFVVYICLFFFKSNGRWIFVINAEDAATFDVVVCCLAAVVVCCLCFVVVLKIQRPGGIVVNNAEVAATVEVFVYCLAVAVVCCLCFSVVLKSNGRGELLSTMERRPQRLLKFSFVVRLLLLFVVCVFLLF